MIETNCGVSMQIADWACVQDETQAEPLHLALQMDKWIDRHSDIFFSKRTTHVIYSDACNRMT